MKDGSPDVLPVDKEEPLYLEASNTSHLGAFDSSTVNMPAHGASHAKGLRRVRFGAAFAARMRDEAGWLRPPASPEVGSLRGHRSPVWAS